VRRIQLLLRILVALAAAVSLQWVLVPSAHAATLPLGKANWVVSVGGFRTDAWRNYVRLGYVVFGPDGTVEHNFWTWNQADHPSIVNSGDVYYCGEWEPGTNPRNNCPIPTVGGFTGDPNGHMYGTYTYAATSDTEGTATIHYTKSVINGTTTAINLTETWTVSEPRAGLGRMALASDSYSITYGIGYGSNFSLAATSKATMTQVRARPESFLLEGQAENGGNISSYTRGQNGGLNMSGWNVCDDGSCLGNVQYNAGCSPASCCPAGAGYDACVQKLNDSGNRRFYYMTGDFGGRRNSYTYWCECLSYNACYTLNSHIKPLLQVVDDTGTFQGWVGVEVSPDRTTPVDQKGEFYASYALVD
jgi:hypothetical protein